MSPVTVHTPTTIEQAVQLHTSLGDARYLAGGTDLLPNRKHQLHTEEHLVALQGIDELRGIERLPDGSLRLGALATLHQIAGHPLVRAHAPALAYAASQIAGPQHRRMGTLGGNVMLDTRCLFYNQSKAWRTALGSCLKAEGSWCHVIGSSKGCVAAQSSDTVPVLLAFDAALHAHSPEGAHEVPFASLYTNDGRQGRHLRLPPGALLTHVVLPPVAAGTRSVYRKVRSRAAIDFPQLGVAARGVLDPDGVCTDLAVVLGALLPQPRVVRHTDVAVGTRLDDTVIEAVAEHAFKQARPQSQVHGDPDWRREQVRVNVRRALHSLRG
jgi:4-hydroxybenzoyl-CoA reductase subunit beta